MKVKRTLIAYTTPEYWQQHHPVVSITGVMPTLDVLSVEKLSLSPTAMSLARQEREFLKRHWAGVLIELLCWDLELTKWAGT